VNRIPAALPRKPLLSAFLTVALAAVLIPASPAAAGLFAPEHGGSPNADHIAGLYRIIFVIALVVFVIVEGALIYSLFAFRARKGAVAAQIRGNTRLEIGWTLGAAVILVALALVTFIKLDGIRTPENTGANGLKLSDGVLASSSTGPGSDRKLPPNGRSLNICVNGQQYIWRYTYGQADCTKNDFKAVFSYEEMVVPTDTTVTLDITSQDVAHSWWVPKLGGKFDAVPGYVNHTWFKIPASKAGTIFTGNCAELCGRNHANMTAQVKAVPPNEYVAWLARQKAAIAAADKAAAVQRKQFDSSTP
jgi:cytochrome c oxidase subunit 2